MNNGNNETPNKSSHKGQHATNIISNTNELWAFIGVAVSNAVHYVFKYVKYNLDTWKRYLILFQIFPIDGVTLTQVSGM